MLNSKQIIEITKIFRAALNNYVTGIGDSTRPY